MLKWSNTCPPNNCRNSKSYTHSKMENCNNKCTPTKPLKHTTKIPTSSKGCANQLNTHGAEHVLVVECLVRLLRRGISIIVHLLQCSRQGNLLKRFRIYQVEKSWILTHGLPCDDLHRCRRRGSPVWCRDTRYVGPSARCLGTVESHGRLSFLLHPRSANKKISSLDYVQASTLNCVQISVMGPTLSLSETEKCVPILHNNTLRCWTVEIRPWPQKFYFHKYDKLYVNNRGI